MEDQSKSEGAKLGYKRLETTYPFATKWLRLRQDRILLNGDKEITFTYLDRHRPVQIGKSDLFVAVQEDAVLAQPEPFRREGIGRLQPLIPQFRPFGFALVFHAFGLTP